MENKTKAQELGITVFPYEECDSKGNVTYWENSFGSWFKNEYDSNENKIYYEDNSGYWEKQEFNDINYVTYFETIHGDWYKAEYDSNGNQIYYEDNTGYWCKKEYDDKGNLIYFEDSDGEKIDSRQKTTTTKFELSDKQQKELDEWKEAIKTIYGEYGSYTYSFTPTGIGCIVEVYSELANIKKDFTHEEDW